jgi:transposase
MQEGTMPKKIYIVGLTEDERAYLLDLIKSGEHSARKLNRARILLLADEDKSDREIADALHTSTPTAYRIRKRFVEGNLEGALNERPRIGGRLRKKLDEKGIAVLEMLARSKPPEGQKGWTMQLLADRLVELKIVDSICAETVRQACRKKGLSLG